MKFLHTFNKIKYTIMEELYQQIAQRVLRVQEVTKSTITSERFRTLKEEEKNRCEKENFILSMMRANKSVQIISKKYKIAQCYEIMRKINPQFTHEINLQKLQENFLNDFVGLYRLFFYKYEELFNFKMKIQNLIRPTNHNLIIDLVRYLVDFSRDYYQQTFFWYMKSHCKVEKIEEEESRDLEQNADHEKQLANPKKIGRASLNQIVLQRSISKKSDQSDLTLNRKQPQKNYEILDITGFPLISSQPKDNTTNLEVLKIRINDFYRQSKSRNSITKANINNYYSRYFGQGTEQKQKEYVYIEKQDQQINKAIHPFKLSLNIQKSGFNFLSVTFSQNKFYVKGKDKKLSPLKVSQRLIPTYQIKSSKQQFMLTSLKVIRISDSFLPPIISQSSLTNTSNVVTSQNASRIHLMSSNSAANDQQIQRKIKKQNQNLRDSANHSKIEERMPKQKSYRKLNEIKRNFKSEEKKEGGILSNSNNVNTNMSNDPEKKIFDWLQKLRQVKQIERKKIMGLS